jgi:hypothetical protein
MELATIKGPPLQIRRVKMELVMVNALAAEQDKVPEKEVTLLMQIKMGPATITKPAQKNKYSLLVMYY